MKNRKIICLLSGIFLILFLYPHSASGFNVDKNHIDSMLSGNDLSRERLMKKLYKKVASDSAERKTAILPAGFRDKYQHDESFNYKREEKISFIDRIKKAIERLLRNLIGLEADKDLGNFNLIIIRILAGAILVVVIYFAIRLFIRHKGLWFFSPDNRPLDIDINNTEQLIQFADFSQLIAETEKKGNTRQSIRLYYLWLLKEMKDEEIIHWQPEKTNADYMNEIRDETTRSRFGYLSYLFNNIWYGEFSIADNEYMTAKDAFLSYLEKGGKR